MSAKCASIAKAAVLITLAWSLAPSPARAVDWPVVPGQSIQAAIDLAAPGDRILVQPGTYYEVLDLQGKQLELLAPGGPAATTIDGTGLDNTLILAIATPAGTRVTGFTLTHGVGWPLPTKADFYGGAVYAREGAQLEVTDCVLIDNGWVKATFGGAIVSTGLGTHVIARRCVIARNRAWACGGATLCDYDGTLLLEQCTVFGNMSNDFFGWQGGVGMANAGKVWVSHSIVWGNQGQQIAPFGGPYSAGTAAYVDFSDVEDGFTGVGNINADPLFLDAANYDFHLLAGSPCIDAGDPGFAFDCDGTLADLGAELPLCLDCNGNGINDAIDVPSGLSFDCNGNAIPDECDVLIPGADMNANGFLDACEFVVSTVAPAVGPWYVPRTLTLTGSNFSTSAPAVVIFRSPTTPTPGDAPLPATVVDASTVKVDVPIGAPTGAGIQDIIVRQNGIDSTLAAGWKCLPSLQPTLTGDAVAGGTLDMLTESATGGLVLLYTAADLGPSMFQGSGIHCGVVLDLATTTLQGAGPLFANPAFTWTFAPGTVPPGLTIYFQGLVVEATSYGIELSFSESSVITIP